MIDINTLTPLQRTMLGLWLLGMKFVRWEDGYLFTASDDENSGNDTVWLRYMYVNGGNPIMEMFPGMRYQCIPIAPWLHENVLVFEGVGV